MDQKRVAPSECSDSLSLVEAATTPAGTSRIHVMDHSSSSSSRGTHFMDTTCTHGNEKVNLVYKKEVDDIPRQATANINVVGQGHDRFLGIIPSLSANQRASQEKPKNSLALDPPGMEPVHRMPWLDDETTQSDSQETSTTDQEIDLGNQSFLLNNEMNLVTSMPSNNSNNLCLQDIPKTEIHFNANAKGLRRNMDELQTKLQLVRGPPKDIAAVSSRTKSQEPISTLVIQHHGLHRTAQERKGKLQVFTRISDAFLKQDPPISNVSISSVTLEHHGLNRTAGERKAKLQVAMRNSNSCIVHNDLQHHDLSGIIPKKGLHRNDAPQIPPPRVSNSLEAEEEEEENSQAPVDIELQPLPAIASEQPDLWNSQNQSIRAHDDESTNQSITNSETDNTRHQPTSQISSTSGLVEARIVSEESSRQVIQEAQQVSDDEVAEAQKHMAHLKMRLQRQRLGYCLIAGVIIILSIAVMGVAFAVREPEVFTFAPTVPPSMEPSIAQVSSAPTGQFDIFRAGLPNYTQTSLQNFSTAQSKAFEWLSNHKDSSTMPEWKKRQLFALSTFFYSFEGEYWPDVIKDRWTDDTVDECYWFSGSFGSFWDDKYLEYSNSESIPGPCNIYGEFQILALDELALRSLAPSIPPEIALLTSLSVLSLRWNDIGAPITNMLPTELGSMGNLSTLLLQNNYLTGQLPTVLGLLTSLEHLDISWNSLSGSLPSELGRMSNLKLLRLSNSSLTGVVPSELGLMAGMEFLYLSGNGLSGKVPSELGGMSNLTLLFLDYNSLTGLMPSELGLMTHMESLLMTENSLFGLLPSEVGRMTNLEYFSVAENSLSGTISIDFGGMTLLVKLGLAGNSFSGTIPSELSLLTSLGYLNLSGSSKLYGTIPAELCNLQDTSCSYSDYFGYYKSSCVLDFECNGILCGCDCQCFG